MIATLALFCLAVSTVLAHNWVNSPSRSEFANTVKPTLPSATGEPHVKVIAGQKFQIEWVTGHDSDCYFVLLSEKDHLNNMLKHSTKMFEDYLNNAPAAQKKRPAHPWMKYHRKVVGKTEDNHNKGTDNFFADSLKKGDKWFFDRPAVFEGRFSGVRGNRGVNLDHSKLRQMVYKDNTCTEKDRRVVYKSSKYPWVIAMHKFQLCAGQANRPDVALLEFPRGTPPGNYIVQWTWRGYYDVIDVEVVAGTKPVAKPYGDKRPPPPPGTRSSYRRVDHCLFPESRPVNKCTRMRTDAEGCLMMCDRLNYLQCSGVNIVPVINPPTVYKAFKDQIFIPYEFANECRKSQIQAGAKVGDRVCYPLLARPKTDVIDSYVVTDDADDPIFYSTCLIRLKPSSFGGNKAPPPRVPTWQFRHKCVDCTEAKLSTYDYYIPRWGLADKCANCDQDGPKKVTPPKHWNATNPWAEDQGGQYCLHLFSPEKHPGYKCNGKPNRCYKTKALPSGGQGDINDHDCAQLVAADPQCSKIAFKREWPNVGDPSICFCWRSEPCCGECIKKSSTYYHMYLVK